MLSRIAVGLSLVFGLSYLLTFAIPVPEWAAIGWKGTGVGLLALAAASAARSWDGWLLASVMALGALGDVLLEIAFTAGAVSFALGHVAAILLYLRNRRMRPSGYAVPALLLFYGLVMPALLLPKGEAFAITLYTLLLTAMASAAWRSRFPRALTASGALLFVFSDSLIVTRMGPLAGAGWIGPAIWLSYYAGQLMIFLGVRRGLAERG